ncbi:hypothetical protein [Halocatena marina]|uniref:Uncharacterized protein n=1 Tax=Halocatena marina TaxID=2934937 RepID=A0ABD5YXN2_9EURY|nr:hypothetical protein [Halocatena marina]
MCARLRDELTETVDGAVVTEYSTSAGAVRIEQCDIELLALEVLVSGEK